MTTFFKISILCMFMTFVSCETSCPSGCVCNDGTVSCMNLDKFPQLFMSNDTRVEISMSHLPEIPPNAFQGFPNAQMIEFKQVEIGTIRGCAFEGMSTTASVLIDLTEINTIEGNAFHNIHVTGSTEFTISHSTITAINSFAFDSVQGFESFEIRSTDITTIQNYAFHRLNNIDSFNMVDVNITSMHSNAMEGFMNIKEMDISHTTFGYLECNTLEKLRSDLGKSFSFYNLDVKCDCELAWLRDAGTGDGGLRLDDVICFAPQEFKQAHLVNLTRAGLCKGQRTPSCNTPSPNRPEACLASASSAALVSTNQMPFALYCILVFSVLY